MNFGVRNYLNKVMLNFKKTCSNSTLLQAGFNNKKIVNNK